MDSAWHSAFLTSPHRGALKTQQVLGSCTKRIPQGSQGISKGAQFGFNPSPLHLNHGGRVYMWLLTQKDEGIYRALTAAGEYSGRALSGEGFLDLWQREYKRQAGASWGHSQIQQFNLQHWRLQGMPEGAGRAHPREKQNFLMPASCTGEQGREEQLLGWDWMPSTPGAASQP